LFITLTCHFVASNHSTDLPYLIWLGFCSSGLKIENVGNTLFRKDVMAASNAFIKTQVPKKPTQIFE